MCMTKRFLDWLEGKFDALDYEHDSIGKIASTGAGVGLIEGIIDGCVFIGAIEIILAIIADFLKFMIWIRKKKN